MYTASDINDLARIIVRRGIQVDPAGLAHKHNELPGLPLAPLKLHLCTPDLRPEARLTEDDMHTIVRLMAAYLMRQKLHPPAMSGLPRVGERYALLLQEYLRTQFGLYVPVVRMKRTELGGGIRRLGIGEPSAEYPSGPLWLIDDLINWGNSHLEAHSAYTEAGYQVTDSLVAVDYGTGGTTRMIEHGVSVHSLISLESILSIAAHERLLESSVIAGARTYVTQSVQHNALS